MKPSQILTEWSKLALAMSRASGENLTSLTTPWWPVIRGQRGRLAVSGVQRERVLSSDPATRRSGPFP